MLLSCRVPEDDGGCAVRDQTCRGPAAAPNPAPPLPGEQRLCSAQPLAARTSGDPALCRGSRLTPLPAAEPFPRSGTCGFDLSSIKGERLELLTRVCAGRGLQHCAPHTASREAAWVPHAGSHVLQGGCQHPAWTVHAEWPGHRPVGEGSAAPAREDPAAQRGASGQLLLPTLRWGCGTPGTKPGPSCSTLRGTEGSGNKVEGQQQPPPCRVKATREPLCRDPSTHHCSPGNCFSPGQGATG